jgi:hypothetical protein
MGIPRRNDPFRAYQLLPPAFNNQRRVSKAICVWSAIICTMLAILGGLAGATALEAERNFQARQQMVAAALPLLDLRGSVLRLSQSNRLRLQWCEWVESARPDGNAFETLAAITTTSQSDGRNIRIDRILIKMPLEYPATDETPPEWAAPQLGITARVNSPGMADQWIRRLNSSDRFTDAEVAAAPLDLANGRVEITASPITTRVLP